MATPQGGTVPMGRLVSDVEHALRESEARLQALLASLDDLVFELDRDGIYLGIWTSRDDLLVAPRAQLLGRNVRDFLGDELGGELIRRIRRALESNTTDLIEYTLEVAAGTLWFEGRVAPIVRSGASRSVCFLSREITGIKLAEQARDDAEERLREQATHDSLTGLANRSHFRDRLERALRRCRREGDELAVLVLDVDRFKEINDTLGHAVGDAVLEEVASRLTTVTREGDLIARIGGDEFALLLRGSPKIDPSSVAGRLADFLSDPIAVDDVLLNVDISAGAAVCPRHGKDADSLLRRADIAMYAAKRTNAGFLLYRSSLDHRAPDQLALAGELRGAIGRGELVLHYQPVIDLSTGAMKKVEALVRWLHPQRGIIPPDKFIPLVAETAVMTSLTHYVLDHALAQCRQWIDQGCPCGVAVNVGMRDLIDANFPDDVATLLAAHGVPPGALTIEITEKSIMTDARRAKRILNRICALGVHLSVDDFGSGYSSLTYLTQLPVDEVKIDRSFIMNMATEPANEAVVRSTIDLARTLGKSVVGEGVETEDVLEHLTQIGCDAAQGFYWSRPLPPDELGAWLAADVAEPGPGAPPS